MYSVTFKVDNTTRRRNYKTDTGALKAIWKWLQQNAGSATYFAPYEQPKIYTDASELDYLAPKKIDFYSSVKWKRLKVEALNSLPKRCCYCGATYESGIQLHVDHIKPRSKYPELALEMSNLQILCSDCNIGKSNRLEEELIK